MSGIEKIHAGQPATGQRRSKIPIENIAVMTLLFIAF
jgi:hypothetical protein